MFRKITLTLLGAAILATSSGSILAKEFPQKYSDIPASHPLFKEISILSELNIINGYPDGTFRPNETINRAELLKMIMGSKIESYNYQYAKSENCFDDVQSNQWYTSHICHAKNHKMISGYPGTNLFKPDSTINTAEALKIIFNIHEVPYVSNTNPWYTGLLDTAGNKFEFYDEPGTLITRGSVASLLLKVIKESPRYQTYNFEEALRPPLENSLQDIYETRPTDEEIAQIMSDFEINYIDSENEKWPQDFTFDQSSTNPSKMVLISGLNLLKKQKFSEPLPFTGGISPYEYLKEYTKTINSTLECEFPHALDGKMTLTKETSIWNEDFSVCNDPGFYQFSYIENLFTYIHENAHSIPGDQRHEQCGTSTGTADYSLDATGGYAHEAIYAMWIYKYSLNDSYKARDIAKNRAKVLLQDYFCTKPTHSDPRVQAIIDELVAEIKAEGGSVIGY